MGFDPGPSLPDKRSDFYDKVIRGLVLRRRAECPVVPHSKQCKNCLAKTRLFIEKKEGLLRPEMQIELRSGTKIR